MIIKNIIIALVLYCSLLSGQSAALAGEYIIGISPYTTKSQGKRIFKELLRFLLTNVDVGEKAAIYDAYNKRFIADFSVPNKTSYRGHKAKIRVNADAIKKLKPFFLGSPSLDTAKTNLIKAPQFLEFIGKNVIDTGSQVDIVLIGRPVHIEEAETGFSMDFGFVPSDGHLRAGFKKSIYGLKGKKNLLHDVRVHWGYEISKETFEWNSSLHEKLVERFWSLFVKGQSGELVTFVSDLKTLFQRAANKKSQPRMNYKLSDDTKIEMVAIRREVDLRIINEIFGRRARISTTPPSRLRGKVIFGIKWDCRTCDIDLYSRPKNTSKILYFGNTRSNEGFFYKDHLQAPTGGQLEYISYVKEVDLRKLFIGINFYRGRAPQGVKGILRMRINNKTYEKKFFLKAKKGNQGSGLRLSNKSDYWTRIDPLSVVGAR